MMLTAGFFDLIGAVPFLNIPVDIIGWLIIWLWFVKLGISWKSPKRLAAPAISILIEIIPVLSAVPSFLLAVGASIGIITYEDYQISLKHKGQKTNNKFSKLEQYYSSKQIVSRPEITTNSKEGLSGPNVTPSEYGNRDYSQPKNVYQISDVKPKTKQDNSTLDLAA